MCASRSGPSTLNKDHLPGGTFGLRRCSFLKYAQYSRASRLAIRASRSGIWAFFSVDGPLGGVGVARPDLDALMSALLPFAQRMLSKHGEFYPFGAAIDREGQCD